MNVGARRDRLRAFAPEGSRATTAGIAKWARAMLVAGAVDEESPRTGLTRRTLLATGACATVGAAVTGCAALPDLVRRGGTHPCDARFCRYWAPPRPGRTIGTCTLPSRARGGP